MAYLIYTNRENLFKTVRCGTIRIPSNLEKTFDLNKIKKGNTIFLYDFESKKIYGPFISYSSKVNRERNPKDGPFNGFGNVENHYNYISIKIDCSRMFKRGISLYKITQEKALQVENIKFYIKDEDEIDIIEKLKLANLDKVHDLVINMDLSGELLKTTIVDISKGTKIHNYDFRLKENLFNLVYKKQRMAEYFLKNDDTKELKVILKEIGNLIYDNIFKNLDIDGIFKEGGFIIHISGSSDIFNLPFEICYKDSFIFEKNIVSYRSEESQNLDNAIIKKILIIADPSLQYEWAYNEGIILYNFFKKMRLSVDLIARPLKKDMVNDFFLFYDIIHFAGHGVSNNNFAGWDIGSTFFTVDDIIIQRHLPCLIFASSCGETLRLGLDFLKLGVKNIISSRWVIPDKDISQFIITFYEMMFEGLDIGVAFNRAINKSYRRGDLVPILFTLYGENRLLYERKNI